MNGAAVIRKANFIGGRWKSSFFHYELKNPYDLSTIAEIPLSTPEEMEEAIAEAEQAYALMKTLSSHERSSILYRAAQLLEERAEDFTRTISLEAAKPIKTARMEVTRSIQTFLFAAEEAKRMYGESIPMDAAKGGEGKIAFTVREPIGVIGAITPFNFPLNLVAHKVAPAIASGNTIVLKPAEQTPLTSFKLAELLRDAGLPDGALNVVAGDGPTLGPVLLADERVKKISFTGSPEVGKLIRSQSGLKKITLELGSNSALIIDEQADLDKAVPKALTGAFTYAGQVCIHTQRIYVHEAIYDAFVERFVEAAKTLIVGAPSDEQTDVSAVVNQCSLQRITAWLDEARQSGATFLAGGEANGQVIPPTILTDVNESEKVVCQEVFGPVVIINRVASVEEAVRLTNQSRYGLNAGIFTTNLDAAFRAAQGLHVGQVMINEIPTFRADHMPYGGVKDSGIGKEGIRYAISEMTEEKLIVIQL
ncbi:aldehyde dehydrogenase family protein [Paenibacillus sp. JMULE4]|uniref:aldehyde dehydrogenase family protein n=1 Tax=Paenibacillus sp. JMULE4 TaxID=2518342 RepID=UPI001C2D617F|nr:aldehyde dehydrogenase family protein [Paenibacillus sp. JMULE4]NTZ20117.1 aldehyde dehydrogenase family protein [Paenibacillus sp. JMULE4]